MISFRFGQPLIVTPPRGEGAPYEATYGQPSRHGLIFVRNAQRGLHEVDPGTVTARSLELGDSKVVRHGETR